MLNLHTLAYFLIANAIAAVIGILFGLVVFMASGLNWMADLAFYSTYGFILASAVGGWLKARRDVKGC